MKPRLFKLLQYLINGLGFLMLFFMMKGLDMLQIILIPISLFMTCLEINCTNKNKEEI